MDQLSAIIDAKQKEIEALYQSVFDDPASDLSTFVNAVKKRKVEKSFKQSLMRDPFAVIAEIKRTSPAKQYSVSITDPCLLVKKYLKGGANAISILTDKNFFKGSLEDLRKIKEQLQFTSVTILRKDFILDPIQIAETVMAGADAVLLIVKIVKEKLPTLLALTKAMQIEALVEVDTLEDLERAVDAGAEMIAINNRNLSDFTINLKSALELRDKIPDSIVSVAASGIDSVEKANLFRDKGFNAILVGSALVCSPDPAQLISKFKEITVC